MVPMYIGINMLTLNAQNFTLFKCIRVCTYNVQKYSAEAWSTVFNLGL